MTSSRCVDAGSLVVIVELSSAFERRLFGPRSVKSEDKDEANERI